MLLPPALGFSPHPPVSVYGTGPHRAIAAFLGRRSSLFATSFRSTSHAPLPHAVLPACHSTWLCRSSLSRLAPCACVPAVLSVRGTGIFTCCPSGTPSGLPLGPDFPRADQLYPGILGYSADRIPTYLSLLIPAFSLPAPPPPLPVRLPRLQECSSTGAPLCAPRLRCRVSAPDIFGAGTLDQ